MRPAMIFTWVFGLVLIYLNGLEIFSQLWFQIKISFDSISINL